MNICKSSLLRTSFSSTVLPNLSDLKNSQIGIISRKPEKKVIPNFSRKRLTQADFKNGKARQSNNGAQNNEGEREKRLSRDRTGSVISFVQSQKSLELCRQDIKDQIKFLSPKYTRNNTLTDHLTVFESTIKNNIVEPIGKGQIRKSCKFMRKGRRTQQPEENEVFETSSNLSIISTCGKNDGKNMIEISPILIKQNAGNEYENRPDTNSSTKDFSYEALQFQNEQLCRRNYELNQRVDKVEFQLKSLKQKLQESEQKLKMRVIAQNKMLVNQKCYFCGSIDQKFKNAKEEVSHFQHLCKTKEKEIQLLKKKMLSLQKELDCIAQRQEMLNKKLKDQNDILVALKQEKNEIQEVIECLNRKWQSQFRQRKYLSIQQNTLLKHRLEWEKSNNEIAKLTQEKQSLRTRLAEYKDKLDLMRKVYKKRDEDRLKSEKAIKNKPRIERRDNYIDELFELSSQQSTEEY